MHNPIEQTTTASTSQTNPRRGQSANLGFENQELKTCTLGMIAHTLRYLNNRSETGHSQLKSLFKKWQHIIDIEVTNSQTAKALKLSMQQWLELQINTSDNALQRNARAQRHFQHINTSIAVLNLTKQQKPIRVLHYLMIHPINGLSTELMRTQANLFNLIANHHYQLEQKPNYTKIANRLFVHKQHDGHATHSATHAVYFIMGMTFGIMLAKLLPYSLLGACTA